MTNAMARHDDVMNFYRQQSEISSPGKFASLFGNLPNNVRDLCEVVQNILAHQFWIQDERNYDITVESLKASGRNLNDEVNLRSVEEILEFLIELDDKDLTTTREASRRVVGNCRDYALMLVSMLRHQGIPARVRSGVARYFYPVEEGMLEDHFICEYWDEAEGRWQRTDPQIDDVQRKALSFTMDATNLPPNQFLDAGESYDELKTGKVAPEKIGIFDFRGWPYVHYKLVSDLACVNRVEILAWEGWGVCDRIMEDRLSVEDRTLLAKIAKLLTGLQTTPDPLQEAGALFRTHPDLKLPADYEPYYHELPFLK
ncbi:MAG: transglutaminase-like domain-containing protein [Anaerolineales bacterium]